MWIIIIASVVLFLASKKFSELSGKVFKQRLEPSVVKFIAVCIFVATLFLNLIDRNKHDRQESETTTTQTFEIQESETEKINRLYGSIQKDSAYLSAYDYKGKATEDIPTMRASITFLKRIADGEYRSNNSKVVDRFPKVVETFNDMEKEAEKILKEAMPLYRKQFTQIMKNRLWEENIDVKVSGNSNTILWFTGGIFASNKQIKLFQEQIVSEVRTFGFKRTCYKWIKHDSEYTYYDL